VKGVLPDRFRKILSDPKRAVSLLLSVGLKKRFKGFCTLCGKENIFFRNSLINLREDFICVNCGSNSRNRHLALLIAETYGKSSGEKSLPEALRNMRKLKVYEAQSTGPLHNILSNLEDYTSSEYTAEKAARSGCSRVEDLEKTSFTDDSLDLIITQDVFEHIKNPERAFGEIFRILRPGGRHIFTVPYNPGITTRRIDPAAAPRHSDGASEIQVRTEFGSDLPEIISGFGFLYSEYTGSTYQERQYRIYWSRVFISEKPF